MKFDALNGAIASVRFSMRHYCRREVVEKRHGGSDPAGGRNPPRGYILLPHSWVGDQVAIVRLTKDKVLIRLPGEEDPDIRDRAGAL